MSVTLPALADLTPAWIGALLRSRGVDVDVSHMSITSIGTGQVGATYRLALKYSRKSEGAPDTLVAKLPSNDALSKATGKTHLTYIRESRFYELFADKKPMPVPDHLFIAFDDESHDFALVMRDLPRHKAGNQLETPSLAEAELAMVAAASIHAGWWGDPLLDTLDWLNGTKAVPPPLDVDALYTMFWPMFCERFANRVTPDMRTVGDAYIGKVGGWARRDQGPRCLTHGDFRPDNMLFDLDDKEQPIVVVDWQTVGVGEGVGDIAYYLGTALEPSFRRAHEGALFARYVDRLLELRTPLPDASALWDACRVRAFAGFLMGVTAAMVVGQTDRGDSMFLAMCERSAAMVLDHADVALPTN